jgi:hypothetical protein
VLSTGAAAGYFGQDQLDPVWATVSKLIAG